MIARTVGTGQSPVSQWVDTAEGDTFWVQQVSYPVASPALIMRTIPPPQTAGTLLQWRSRVRNECPGETRTLTFGPLEQGVPAWPRMVPARSARRRGTAANREPECCRSRRIAVNT